MTSPAPILDYQTELREERLPDGTLRIEVVVDRSGGFRGGIVVTTIGVAGTMFLGIMWGFAESFKSGVAAVTLGPLTVLVGVLMMVQQSLRPGQQVHSVEVNRDELVIYTVVSGDDVERRFPRYDLKAVRICEQGLEISSGNNTYHFLSQLKPVHQDMIVDAIAKEMRL